MLYADARVYLLLKGCLTQNLNQTSKRINRLIQGNKRLGTRLLSSNHGSGQEDIAPKNILHLHKREIFQDIYPPASVNLPNLLQKKQCFYSGFDPTADSLHVGNLLSLMALLHCQRAGHDVIVVIGTATVKAGDPSGHSKDRHILNDENLQENADMIADSINKIFENHASHIYSNRLTKKLPPLKILFNHHWYKKFSSIDFITNVCKKFRIGPMLETRYIKDRVNSNEGLALSEFLYQVLQSNDWDYLFYKYNCCFQIGGIDQLGNISAGHDLIRRTSKSEIYGLLTPLVTTLRGEKLGKSAGNSVWLNPKKTSPFEFYQYFYRQPDSVVEKFLKYFTFIDLNQIEDIMMDHRKHPHRRNAQDILARNVCKIVHGEKGLQSAELCTRALYHGTIEDLEELSSEEIDTTFAGAHIINSVLEPDTTVYDLAALIAKAIPEGTTGENIITSDGVKINGLVMNRPQEILILNVHVLKNDITLLSIGKKHHYVVRWSLPRIAHNEESHASNPVIPGVDVSQFTKREDDL